MKRNIQTILLLFLVITLASCKTAKNSTDNPVYDKYRSSFKSIQPGFHILGSYENTHRLKYIGEPNQTVESAKEVWLERAKSMCKNTRQSITTDSQNIVEKTTENDVTANAAGVCAVAGAIGCIIVDFISTNYISEKSTKHPEIEGTIDCNPT